MRSLSEPQNRGQVESKKRACEKPAEIHREKVPVRAVVCPLSNEVCGPSGPVMGS